MMREALPESAFVRLVYRLRSVGVPVSLAQTLDFLESITAVGLVPTSDFRAAARCTLARRPDQFSAVEAEIDVFLRELAGVSPGTDLMSAAGTTLDSRPATATPDDEMWPTETAAIGSDGETESPGSIAQYSFTEALRRKDFALYSDEELQQAKHFLRSIRWQPPHRRSRRRQPARRGHELDMRRLLRKSLSYGGEIAAFPRRSQQSRPRSLVVLCDVSGSMDTYTRMLLQFLHSLRLRCTGIEVFLFGTRLTRVTRALAHRDLDDALAGLTQEVTDWSGGTRIGESLSAFNRAWARRVTAHGAVTMIISDGWDRGDPSRLAQEMARLHRLSHRLIWLNPLLGTTDYQPLTQGMRVALPFVDDFLPANNLTSLTELAQLLNGLD